MIKPQHLWRRVGRWQRRTLWLLGQMRADFGFASPSGPLWLRDNPFLFKQGRAEARGGGLSLRLALVVMLLGGLLLGGLYLERTYVRAMATVMSFVFHSSFPVVLFVLLSFIHVLLIVNARTAASTVLAEEARRSTLPDLLLTPLRRAEMLLAMGVGPARSAGLLALVGLPIYLLLGQFGGLTGWETVCLYILFALLCYQPPVSAVPALSGLAPTPDAPPGQFTAVPNRRMTRRASYLGIGFPIVLGFLFLSRFLGTLGGGWLTHLFTALGLPLLSGFSFLIFMSWPYYAMQMLSDHLPFFHTTISPLFYVLPLMAMQWAGSALLSASALSAGDLPEMHRLPIWTRAQTLGRWTARVAGLCALAVVWRAWVESGDTAGLVSPFAAGPGWDAAGLLLLLGGCSLPNLCGRALAISPQRKSSPDFRAPALVLRRALKRSLRPLGVALGVFLIACVLGRLSPFAAPVYEIAGKILLVGLSTVFWAVGVRRALPSAGKWVNTGLLYGLPFAALSTPGLSLASAFSPACAWVRLFSSGPGLVSQFPLWHLGPVPSFWICTAVPFGVGAVLMTAAHRGSQTKPVRAVSAPKRAAARNEAQTAALLGWVTRRTDNPLFTSELRSRTRSGRWFDWLCLAPLFLAAAAALTVAYPTVIEDFYSTLSPFRFFSSGYVSGRSGMPWLELASLLLAGQCYLLGFRGPLVGEALVARDRQQGTWGFILLTPLSVRQIFWGKVAGQTAAVGTVWAVSGVGCLVLYGLAAPGAGVVAVLEAWAVGQLFVASLFILGVSLGTALAMFPKTQKSLRGLSMLLFVLLLGVTVYAEVRLLPLESFGDWQVQGELLVGNSVYLLALSAGLFWAAERRLSVLRGRDIAAGDGLG